ncbi:hypothetical protein [Ktedonospora formicarum]|uniref:Uncharacterized protein n=1 Tax=Ktedonospora formicarum TaxID=2778364 RepID=A0A8J3I9Y3_9CHLR|nr:hypothetical protein [Ktedonospora formicarum]GHO48199.1 hypothetical protein KSX_63620 [Ktedonospora formicarum]
MQDAKTIATSPRPVSSFKYALLTALAISGLRVILYVMMQKTVFIYHSDATLTFKSDDAIALIDTLVLGFVSLPFYAFVGWLISRKTGSIRTGLLTGLKAGLYSGLAIYIVFAIIVIGFVVLLMLLASAFPHNQDSFLQFGGNVTWWVFRAILVNNLLFVAFDMVCGTLIGWFGAMLGFISKKPSYA